MGSMLPSIFALGLATLFALLLTLRRRSSHGSVAERLAAARALALATGVQAIHFAEEAGTGFHEALPAQFGLPSMSFSIFAAFNLVWLAIWMASVPGLRSSHPAAFFAAWFLAIAGMFNGIAHPLLAIASGGYFPGLVTSPFIAFASVWVWRRLLRATGPTGGPEPLGA